MTFRTVAMVAVALGLIGCSKTTTAENTTTTEIVSNDAGLLNAADNAADLDAGNSGNASAGNAL
ncbi:hypothetical protein FHS31_000108 [Sphingomonas vulcanisoli]|uniref:Circumsporozoite protein n=1 Tax=Sphingomonas vulcanisoli TaxID=1658060 RepID=A0ABX0TLY7_9SPHN|nr:hypothetical protein [Sphingomonas vulcanisoli]NIJ06526.1 hypothetical protein [Sphingomonas vulcanisoli]